MQRRRRPRALNVGHLTVSAQFFGEPPGGGAMGRIKLPSCARGFIVRPVEIRVIHFCMKSRSAGAHFAASAPEAR
jgi:hypothetical protein